MNLNQQYQKIISECKFISKKDEWFVEGSEAKLIGSSSYSEYEKGDKFNKGWSLFEGLTMETYKGYTGELPREDGETCSFNEFYIYDKSGNEISELTLEEYYRLIRKQKLKRIND